MRYPLIPKSTKALRVGQFWAVPFRGGFGCGRVLQLNAEGIPVRTRAFFGGLHRWSSQTPPDARMGFGSEFVAFGVMHIQAILATGGAILGERPLEADGIELPYLLSAHGGPGTMLLRGALPVRRARKEEWGTIPVLGFWGYDYIAELATHHLPQVA